MDMLRAALEQNTETTNSEKTIIMKGPLADIYTKALDVAYAKEDPTESLSADPALESAAIDVMLAKELAKSLAPSSAAPTDNFQTVFGVSKDDVGSETIVNVANELTEQNDGGEFILIIDGTAPGANGEGSGESAERLEYLSNALECLVSSFGGRTFTGLAEFAKSRS